MSYKLHKRERSICIEKLMTNMGKIDDGFNSGFL